MGRRWHEFCTSLKGDTRQKLKLLGSPCSFSRPPSSSQRQQAVCSRRFSLCLQVCSSLHAQAGSSRRDPFWQLGSVLLFVQSMAGTWQHQACECCAVPLLSQSWRSALLAHLDSAFSAGEGVRGCHFPEGKDSVCLQAFAVVSCVRLF